MKSISRTTSSVHLSPTISRAFAIGQEERLKQARVALARLHGRTLAPYSVACNFKVTELE